MKRNKKFDIILSIIIAFAGWVYVIYRVDPTTTRTYHDVPITYTNESQLEDKGIGFKSSDTDSISVEVSAKRSVLNDLDSDDLTASVDLSGAGEGENTLKVKISAPDNVKVESQDKDTVTVNTEKSDTKTVSARAVYTTKSNGEEPMITYQSSQYFEISGAKSRVNKVAYVRLPIERSKTSDTPKTFSLKPVAVDSDGERVAHVTVSPDQASATVTNGATKTVSLKVNVTNPDSDEYLRTYDVPSSITIKGSKSALKNIDSIETETINISNMTKSDSLGLHYVLPAGVQVANKSLDLSLPVTVTKYTTKTFKISSDDIDVTDLGEDYKVKFNTTSVTVEATDTAKKLKSLDSSNFKVSVSAKGLTAGDHTLTASVDSEEELHNVELKDQDVDLTIKNK